jgi:hypothetical protein
MPSGLRAPFWLRSSFTGRVRNRQRVAGSGWIYKTKEELERETGLSRHEQNTCVEDLKKKKVLGIKYDRLDHRLYYKICKEALDVVRA